MGLFSSKSEMKSMGEQDGFTITAVGSQLYFLLPKEPTNRVIISAHGGHTLTTTNTFKVPQDKILRFYSDDTFSVEDPGFDAFYTKEAPPKEVLSEGDKCFDYVLSKYQGKGHNEMGETYQSIARTMNREFRNSQTQKDAYADAQAKGKQDKVLQILGRNAAAAKVPAVLTVRNRMLKSDMRLSVALEAIKTLAPQIVLFDCLFCRSTLFGGSQKVALVDRI